MPSARDTVSTGGFRYRPSVLEKARAAFPQFFNKVPTSAALTHAKALDNGDRYLNGKELGEGLRKANWEMQPYQVWLKDPKRTIGVVDAGRVKPAVFAAAANAGRQVMHELGRALKKSEHPDLINRFVAVPVFSPSGDAGAADIAHVVVPRNIGGLPRLVPDENGRVPFYYRLDEAFKEPRYYGPFEMTPDGVVAQDGKIAPLTKNGAVDFAATLERFARTVDFSKRGDMDALFLEPTRVDSARKDEIVKELLAPALGRVTWNHTVKGQDAIDRYLETVHGDAQTLGTMRALLTELFTSGAVAEAVYMHGERTEDLLVSSGDVIVLIDHSGKAFGFMEGTL